MEDEKYRHEHIFTMRDLEVAFAYRYDGGSFVTNHWHDSIEIIYIVDGSTDIIIHQRVFTVHAGECMVINAGTVHSTRNMYGNHSIFMQVPLEILERCLPDKKAVNFDVPLRSDDKMVCENLERIKRVIREMRRVMADRRDGYTLKFESLLYELLYELYRNFRSGRPEPADIYEEEARLTQVIDYTQAHYKEPVSIKEAASVIHLQPEYFCRYFKKCMGMTYLQYINELRLSYIYQDLLDTSWPLYQILDSHGFKNYKLFRRLFYERFGCTPGQLRQRR